jgi:HSP20 family protein
MSSRQAMQATQQPNPPGPLFVEAEKLFEQMKELTRSIASRAYEFFEARGREFGHDLEDWVRAESEVMRRVPVEIKESENRITVRAEVPGFAANEIKVSVESDRLAISGSTEKASEEKTEQTLHSEFSSSRFCRELRLPAEIDPSKTAAVLKDGILELSLAKAAEGKAVNVEVRPK